ncbi:unnamed protein product [Effrenium voratum]|uniref:Fatty acid hydroxylase domain-containing protein n=1 Tax=Effrenium voratum TaxID=2562239 RepID=A0AA36MSA2_9DINO|nr:unnamed protein product [Effrenium voratum]CAJ1377297.1 unnamed protein product [Effrenium voratum]CAJ1430699.1 unnamed protein product [Effrenium voratum]
MWDGVLQGIGNLASAITALLLAEMVVMDVVLPPWIPTIEAFESLAGKWQAMAVLGIMNSSIAFWGIGGLFALPALLKVSRWKIQAKTCDASMLLRSLPLITFNHFLGAVLALPILRYTLPETSFDWRALPSTNVLARDVCVWLVVEEVLFFYVHRWLHENKKMYAAVHKLHHTWTAPVSLVAIYCNPFEHVVSNILPVLAGPVLCRSHAAAFGVFLFVGTIHTLAVHSGYWICDDKGMHDEHHAKFSVNYGVLGLMDALYGTYQLPAGTKSAD